MKLESKCRLFTINDRQVKEFADKFQLSLKEACNILNDYTVHCYVLEPDMYKIFKDNGVFE